MAGERILVVGGNAAGLTAASRARRIDPRLDITVLERTSRVAYSTCGTPYFLAGDVDVPDLISMTPADFARDRNITVHTDVQADQVLPSRRRVLAHRTDTGEALEFRFDRLLLATGVTPRLPAIPGTELEGVFSLVGLDDAVAMKPLLDRAGRVAIVGAGYVGLEMAEALVRLGKSVTLYEQHAHVMPAIDTDMSRIVEYELGRHGVSLRTGSRVTALVPDGEGRVSGVRTAAGIGVQPVSAVLLDTGVEPNVALAASAGLRIGELGGIAVDSHLETSQGGVFAAGNCAEAMCLIRGRPGLAHLGTVAAQQGRVAGDNLAGRRTRFRGTLGTTILRVFDLAVGKTGLSETEASAERLSMASVRIEALDRAAYHPQARKIWIKLIASRQTARIVGMQSVGYGDVARRVDVAAAAITAGMSVDDVARLDLAYTPPFGSLWDPLHVAAQALLRKLQESPRTLPPHF